MVVSNAKLKGMREYRICLQNPHMGDVKLTPRQTAAILAKLDDGLRSVSDARDQVIQAMADRRTKKPTRRARSPGRTAPKPK